VKKVLFVCTGNTCRSPMAESILKQLLRERNIKNIRVASCGLAAGEGAPMSENARKALKEIGVRPHRHKAKNVSAELLKSCNLILTMTGAHKQSLPPVKNVFTVREFTGTEDVPDPYGGTLADYRRTAGILRRACEIVLDTIL
jgi:protein-tyrosine phosphatase